MALFTPSVQGQLGTSSTVLLDVTKNETWIIQNFTLTNGSGSTVSDIKIHIYPQGGSANAATIRETIGSLPAGEKRPISLKHNLNSEDILAAEAGTGSVINFIVSYAQRTD